MILSPLLSLLILIFFALGVMITLPIKILKYINLKTKNKSVIKNNNKNHHFNDTDTVIDVDYKEL